MKKNIGILFPLLKSGGVFQYALSIADSLIDYFDEFNYYIFYYGLKNPKIFFKTGNLKNTHFVYLDDNSNSFFGKVKILLNILLGKPVFATSKKNKELFKNINLNLLIIPTPFLSDIFFHVPYVVSIPDYMDKYYSHFPEYSFKTKLVRSILYKYYGNNSILTVADSKQGADDIHKFSHIKKEKIRVISYVPPGYIFKYKNMDKKTADRILKKYNLPEKFLFYPAQFWYHKNHIKLVKALKLIKEKKGIKIPLVLVGDSSADKDNYQKVMDLAQGLNVKHLGYVSDKEMVALYKKSTTLVFTSLGGPTNIPPLEAMVLSKPILCSNLFEMPKQIGSAGVFFNPFSEKDIADKIYRVWVDENLRKELIGQAREKSKEITLENYARKWKEVVNEALNYGK